METANPFPEDDRPTWSANHANWYQTTPTPFHGTSVYGSDIDDDVTDELTAELKHEQIVDWVFDQEALLHFFEDNIPDR